MDQGVHYKDIMAEVNVVCEPFNKALEVLGAKIKLKLIIKE